MILLVSLGYTCYYNLSPDSFNQVKSAPCEIHDTNACSNFHIINEVEKLTSQYRKGVNQQIFPIILICIHLYLCVKMHNKR